MLSFRFDRAIIKSVEVYQKSDAEKFRILKPIQTYIS